MTTSIVVCDDHPVVRMGLRELLVENDLGPVAEVGSAPELLDLVRRGRWDAVLLDMRLPGMNGLEALHQLKQECPQLPVLMLSVHPAEQYAVRALRAGASGYLTKCAAPAELLTAVRTVMGGHKYVTSDVAEMLAMDLERPTDRPAHEVLSDREFQILCLLGTGQTVSEIARTLSLSVKTVSTHRAHILLKLGLETTAQIIRYALEHAIGDCECVPTAGETSGHRTRTDGRTGARPIRESDAHQ
jgi:DNA-binding NarL/FixJ family response regulator